jgi:ectoine hydroxylase-related dioxygenase (phytanoyl-CoA dioxygenase family)
VEACRNRIRDRAACLLTAEGVRIPRLAHPSFHDRNTLARHPRGLCLTRRVARLPQTYRSVTSTPHLTPTRTTIDCRADGWLEQMLTNLHFLGYAVIEGVLDDALLAETRDAMYDVQRRIRNDVGEERLTRAGELGVLRLMLGYSAHFFRYLELRPVLDVVDATVSKTAILHLQNGLVLPSFDSEEAPDVFQLRFHRDFPRVLNGYLMSINTFFAIDEFRQDNGATIVVPATHQREPAPPEDFLRAHALPVECPAGSMIVFDSTLLHAAGENTSGRDRLAINQQFTRSYVKQQVDYVRALGDEAVLAQPDRTQQLLGWYTRVVTSLDEFYRPPEERLYRSGQG